MHKLNPSDALVRDILRAALPGYRGRRVRLNPHPYTPRVLHSYWDGGSRSSYRVYERGVVSIPPTWGGNFDRNPAVPYVLPPGAILVEHVEGPREAVYITLAEGCPAMLRSELERAAISHTNSGNKPARA